MIHQILNKLYNRIGWKTDRKLIVFASDDWGGVRIPSSEHRKQLQNAGFNMDGSRFNRFDTLESDDDLAMLFKVFRKFRDKNGNHPVFTAMTNVANPDFEKIKADNFENFYYEPFTTTLSRSTLRSNVFALYREGIEDKIFVPQFHGREHLNVNRWMRALREDYQPARKAFELEFFQPDKSDLSEPYLKGFGVAYDPDSTSDIQTHREIITDGLQLFSDLFGYKASCFTAPALISNINIEESLHESGIRIIDVPKIEKMPLGEGKYKTRLNYIGKKSSSGARYITRTAVFEPNISASSDNVTDCMVQISACFENRKPAIISNHRAAFMGEIVRSNREKGLMALEDLLSNILQRWSDVEFVDLDHLGQIIANDYK